MKLTVSFLILGGILCLAAFLLAYRLSELMMFIGDFGWFYLSARDMLVSGTVPLVGIPSSHPWLHQGPLWTYILALGFAVSHFNPLSGGVIAIIFGLFSVFLIYLLGGKMFGEQVGLIAALLYATSPLVIIHARMPYHTAPIPFFTLLLMLAILSWIKGNKYAFPAALLSLSLLYNLELATILYIGIVILIFGYGLLKKQAYIKILRSREVITLSVAGLLLPLVPILIYDTQHGYPQTVRFVMWMGYKILTVFGYPQLHPEITQSTHTDVTVFFAEHIQKLLFLPSISAALLLFFVSLAFVFGKLLQQYRARQVQSATILLSLFLLVGIGGFFLTKTTSEAYLPMLFPQIILAVALLIHAGLKHKALNIFTVIVVLFVVIGNIALLLRQNYLMDIPQGGYGVSYAKREQVVSEIVKQIGQNPYTIHGQGDGCEYDSFTMNYTYLLDLSGNSLSRNPENSIVTIYETPTDVRFSVASKNK